MSAPGDILIVAAESVGAKLASQLAPAATVRHTDPYDALVAMRDRRWPVVVLTAPRPDFGGLCRAARRLQARAQLYAVCPPVSEIEVRPLAADVIDDYFVYPPTSADLQRLRGAAHARDAGRPAAEARGHAGVADIVELVNAATSRASLETAVASLVGGYLGREVQWADAPAVPGRRALLTCGPADAARVLTVDGEVEAGKAEALLAGLRGHLPALMTVAERFETLHRLAITDHLTGAYNRRYFYHLTDQILSRARRRGLRASLLLFDIDNFKHYNDAYGHATGDEILKQIASLMRGVTRSHDIIARIGGDEFAVLFWDIEEPRDPVSRPPDSAYLLADRFRQAVEAHAFPSLGPTAAGTLTISGGLATFPRDGGTCRDLLARADDALRSSKQTGKNTVSLIGAAG